MATAIPRSLYINPHATRRRRESAGIAAIRRWFGTGRQMSADFRDQGADRPLRSAPPRAGGDLFRC